VSPSEGPFTVIGDVQAEELVDLGMGGAGNIGTFDEVLYEAVSDDSWETGEEVGSAHALYVITPSGHAIFTITLRFGDEDSEDSLTASGSLPYEEGIRDGVVTLAGGTGSLKNRVGQLRVQVKNPHKYTVQG
jgi:X-X-X-Leu-X-X-Gly heptad repeat protein